MVVAFVMSWLPPYGLNENSKGVEVKSTTTKFNRCSCPQRYL